MNSERAGASGFHRIREAFDRIVELPEPERLRQLRDAVLTDDERVQVSRLLAGHAKHRLFEVAALEWANQLDGDDYLAAMIGRQIGTCELVRLVGRGGSSIVFLARRRVGEGLQDVALKLLNSGLTSPEAHRRFRREQAILSCLSHPNIARLIDAGMSDSGNPFIVMEYVEGQDIVAYASARSLDVRSRIGLLIDVCRAVDAAHRALVVHRDLKPSNVLVTSDGVVKVLDFGIAKMLDDDHLETATQHVALTPAYAAPEQFSRGPAATSMDVYSIGVLSSEVLLGGRLGADATLPPNETSDTWQRWRRVDNDLSQILRAALASEPARRYSSAGHMADDFQRYLDREPLLIVPVSHWYRIRKFVSRHRAAVSAAALFGLAVFAGTSGIAYQWRIARQQASIARDEAKRAGAIRDFLMSLFEAGKADAPLDRKPSIDDIVADAGHRLLLDDAITPPLRTDLLLTLSEVASSIGANDRSDHLLDEVEHLIPALGSHADEAALQVRVGRAGNLLEQTRTQGKPALDLLDPILPTLQARDDETAFKGLIFHVMALQMAGRESEAKTELASALDRFRDTKNVSLAFTAMSAQINFAVGAQHYPEAASYARSAVDFWNAHDQPQSTTALSMWADVAIAREGVGDIVGAEEAYRTAIRIGDRIYAHASPDHAQIVQIYGTFLLVQSRIDEAGVQIRRSLQMHRSIFGDDDPRVAQAMYAMARLYGAQHDFPEAIRWIDKAISLYRKVGHSTMLARSLAARANFHARSGEFDAADRDVQDALDTQKAQSGESHPAYAWILDVRADIELREQRFEDALRTTERVLAINAPAGGAMLQMSLNTRFKHAKALAALERTREALQELDEIEPVYAHIAPRAEQRFDIAAARAIALAQASRGDEARAEAKAALDLLPLNPQAEAATLGRLRALSADRVRDRAR